MATRRKPGDVRDAILDAFRKNKNRELTLTEVRAHVASVLDGHVSASSVRSYLRLNTPGQFRRTGRGTYRLARR